MILTETIRARMPTRIYYGQFDQLRNDSIAHDIFLEHLNKPASTLHFHVFGKERNYLFKTTSDMFVEMREAYGWCTKISIMKSNMPSDSDEPEYMFTLELR